MLEQRIYSAKLLGQIIKRARMDMKLTQKELAEKTGIAQPTISDVETGTTDVRFETLFRITAALNLDIFIATKKASKAEW
ncbi:MAG: transcriptional regulator [Denitrovibrio sp.]|nr:MAG: transcriptional regulator [Denitrovibrio sp.]